MGPLPTSLPTAFDVTEHNDGASSDGDVECANLDILEERGGTGMSVAMVS
jgi:hypothetical protein